MQKDLMYTLPRPGVVECADTFCCSARIDNLKMLSDNSLSQPSTPGSVHSCQTPRLPFMGVEW